MTKIDIDKNYWLEEYRKNRLDESIKRYEVIKQDTQYDPHFLDALKVLRPYRDTLYDKGYFTGIAIENDCYVLRIGTNHNFSVSSVIHGALNDL